MEKLKKLKKRVRSVRHSTGEQAPLKHATGKQLDYKVLYDQFLEEEEEK